MARVVKIYFGMCAIFCTFADNHTAFDMLQYILTQSDRFSVGELAQMAIEGGCGWISLHLPELSDVEIREMIAPDVVDMCREASVFLTIDDRPELARELGLHGVRLSPAFFASHNGVSATAVREDLGPEAVVGVETGDASAVQALVGADIDFVTLPENFDAAQRKVFVDALRTAALPMPVVARGEFTPTQAAEVRAEGCSGVAVGSVVTDAADPIVAMKELIEALA